MSSNCHVTITHDALDILSVDLFLRESEGGAVCLFTGTTRRLTDGRETEELSYEGAEPLALTEINRIVDEAKNRWPILRVAVAHRLGIVRVGEASVLVGVATPHRAASFEACRFIIDTLKERVPIWKKECYTDGSTEWAKGNTPK